MPITHLNNAPVILDIEYAWDLPQGLAIVYAIPINYGFGKVLTDNGTLTDVNTYGPLPSGVFLQTDITGSVVNVLVSLFCPIGFYVISLLDADGNEYLIRLRVSEFSIFSLDEYYPQAEIVNNCGTNFKGINIVWLTKQGGWDNFYFTGKRYIYDTESEANKTFIDSNRIQRKFENGTTYKGVTVSTGVIDLNQNKKLESLMTAIQAFYYDEDIPFYYGWNARFTPIIFDSNDLIVLDSNERNLTRLFRFRIAQSVNIQIQ